MTMDRQKLWVGLSGTIFVALGAYAAWMLGGLALQYFDPAYIVEFRAGAQIGTAWAFAHGRNPFDTVTPEGFSNLYSWLWPGFLAFVGRGLGVESLEGLRALAFAANAGVYLATALLILAILLRQQRHYGIICVALVFHFLINVIRFNLGDWSYGVGLNLMVVALILGLRPAAHPVQLFNVPALAMVAGALKIYFPVSLLCALPNYLAVLVRKPLGIIWVVLAVGLLGAYVYATLICFPTADEHFVAIHQGFTKLTRGTFAEFRQISSAYPFVYVALLLSGLGYWRWVGVVPKITVLVAVLVWAVITLGMAQHAGNSISYTIHIVGPIALAFLVNMPDTLDRRVASATGAVMLIALVSQPIQKFGVLGAYEIEQNRDVLSAARGYIDKNGSENVFVSPMLYFLQDPRSGLLDTGNREHVAAWKNLKERIGDGYLAQTFRWQDTRFRDKHWKKLSIWAERVICTLRCPYYEASPDWQRIRSLGTVHSAFGQTRKVVAYAHRKRRDGDD